jgi:L-fuconolactonase
VIVDAHQHFWDPAVADYPWMNDAPASLRRRFAPEDLEPLLARHGVAGTVLVQARGALDETRALLEIAAVTPFVLGVVGWIDLIAADAAQVLAAFEGRLAGVRHQVHDEPDANWLLQPEVQRGLAAVGDAGLAFDLLVRTAELPAALETARRHPDIQFVLDHIGKPPLRHAGDLAAWSARVAPLAELPNVACKLSGLLTEAEPGTDLAATLERALAWFGPERCMFGSDWPVCRPAGDYGAALDVVRDAVPERDRETVLAATAIRVYGLELP